MEGSLRDSFEGKRIADDIPTKKIGVIDENITENIARNDGIDEDIADVLTKSVDGNIADVFTKDRNVRG